MSASSAPLASPPALSHVRAAVIGGGPAGLMAAEALLAHGIAADVFDAMPSLGRKFLMAGKSGLNITHAEAPDVFLTRFGDSAARLAPMLNAFGPNAVRSWTQALGVATFVGTSGRVFPHDMKAAPLLRAWLHRLRAGGVRVHARHRWIGFDDARRLTFETPAGPIAVAADASVLALGGASWPRLGSDAAWAPWLAALGVAMAPFRPSNCGFDADWSAHVADRFAGQPLKGVTLSIGRHAAHGDAVVTATGLEGGPVYALSAPLVAALAAHAPVVLSIDLLPDRPEDDVAARLARPRGKASWATHLKRTLGLTRVKAALLREGAPTDLFAAGDATKTAQSIAHRIKALPVPLLRPRPMAEAISSAGGIAWDALDDGLGLRALPGVFAAGEMLDWDAPTGGYLITACLATGRWAGDAAGRRLNGG